MQAVLVMFRSDGEKRSFSISREMTIIGRRQDCDLMIPLGEISRKHCRIIKEADTLRLEDLGSSNGTYHNGRRIQEAVLSAGDTIQVGPVSFVVQIDGVPAEDDITPYTGGAVGDDQYQEAPTQASYEQTEGGGEDAMPTEGSQDEFEVIEVPVEEAPAQEDQLEVLPDENPQEPDLEILDDGTDQPAGDDVPPPPPPVRR